MNVAEFSIRWVYSIQHALQSHLESLRDDLASEDQEIREQAMDQADQILNWLHPPLAPLSTAARLQQATEMLTNESLSEAEKLAALKRAGRSSGRRKGRPRTETSQHAIRALTLHLATPLSWREIALEVKGCSHKRPNPERSCRHCGEAIRNAAMRLEAFLKTIGYELPSRAADKLDAKTLAELTALLRVKK